MSNKSDDRKDGDTPGNRPDATPQTQRSGDWDEGTKGGGGGGSKGGK